MRRKLAIDPRQIEHRCNRTHLVIVGYHLFKAERIKQLSLVLLQPTHHGPFPPLTASTSGNHCSRKPSTDFCNKICQDRKWRAIASQTTNESRSQLLYGNGDFFGYDWRLEWIVFGVAQHELKGMFAGWKFEA